MTNPRPWRRPGMWLRCAITFPSTRGAGTPICSASGACRLAVKLAQIWSIWVPGQSPLTSAHGCQ